MANYLLLQFGTLPPQSDAELAETLSAWSAWFNEVGENLVDGGNPLNYGGSVGNTAADVPAGDRQSGNTSSGYTIIKAANLQEARKIAEGCPTAKKGGRIDIYLIYPAIKGPEKP